MPISTDSDAWKESQESPTVEYVILNFLKDNPGEAYNLRELSEELFEMEWTAYEEQHRKREQLPDGEYIDEDEWVDYPVIAYARDLMMYELRMQSLVEKKLVEVKIVDASEFGPEFPDDMGPVKAYSYY